MNLSVKGFDKKNKEVELTNLEWLLDNDTKGKLESDGITAVFTADQAFEGMVKIEVKFEKLSDSIEIEITAMDLGDREYLKAKIDESKDLKQNTPEGNEPGKVSPADHAAFQAVIDAAEAVYNDAQASDEQVAAAFSALQAAATEFGDAFITGDIQLDRTGWTADASDNPDKTNAALDGELSTRWDAKRQQVGKWIELDMGSDQTFNLITFSSEGSPKDLPRGFDLYLAADDEDAEYGEPVYKGGFPQEHPGGIGEIVFEELQTARWIKVVLTEEDYDCYFSIHELYVGSRY